MKNVLITGVSRGLGLEIAKLLLEDGYLVTGVSRERSVAVDKLASRFDGFSFFSSDLSRVDENRTGIIDYILNIGVEINAFVNNAAFAYDDIVTNIDYKTLSLMYQVNVLAPMMITKYVIRNMILHRTQGSIVHVSSISAHTGYKGLAMYASSKGAIEAFSKNVAREWGPKGIRSNCVVPGFMETKMSSGLSDTQREKIYQRTSLKRATDLNSVAETVKFLISEKSKSITGQNIFIDSGTI